MPGPKAHAINAFSIFWKENCYYAFPPFSLIPKILQKVGKKRNTVAVLSCTSLANTNMVANSYTTDCRQMFSSQQSTKYSDSCAQTAEKAPIAENEIDSFSYIRSALNDQGVPIKAQELIIQSCLRGNSTQHILDNGYISVKGKEIPLIPI